MHRGLKTGFAELNKDHELLLRTDVVAWNVWRAENPNIRPDLYKANFGDSRLQGANLDHAYLYGATFRGANLQGATFRGADIRFVDFSGARLVGAVLRTSDAHASDMSRANLSGADLRRVTFSKVNLSGAILEEANLGESMFFEANLDQAILRKANLQGAQMGKATFVVQATGRSVNLGEGTYRVGHLPKDEIRGAAEFVVHQQPATLTNVDLSFALIIGANLSGIEIEHSNFREAILIATDLADASFKSCDLSRSVWGGTIVNSTNLAGANGLETVRHVRPSKLGIDTIVLSEGRLPDLFIRGCGYHPDIQRRIYLADRDGEHAEWTTPPNLKLASCFISYSSRDRSFAEKLRQELNAVGVEYWYDHEHMIDGRSIANQIDIAIASYDRMALICSESALMSGWVGLEIEKAFQEEERRKAEGASNWRVLFPIMIDDSFLEARDARTAYLRNDRRATDFRHWEEPSKFQVSLEHFLKGLLEN